MNQNIKQVTLVRHGVAKYENIQPTHDTSATDLREAFLPQLQAQARHFVSTLQPHEIKKPITIWTSPIPRAIQTARMYGDALEAAGGHIRKPSVFSHFREADNFRFPIFNALYLGGSVVFQGNTYQIDVKETNPTGLSEAEYFFTSAWEKIPVHVLEKYGELGQWILGMEAFDAITHRTHRALHKIVTCNSPVHVIIFTHQCCTDQILRNVNGYMEGGIDPGDWVQLRHVESNRWQVLATSKKWQNPPDLPKEICL